MDEKIIEKQIQNIMKITTISYSKTFPLAAYSNEKIGLEATIEEGDSVDFEFMALKNLAECLHFNNNPHLSDGSILSHENPATVPTEKPVKTVLDDIMACTTLEGANGLKGYKMLASTNSEWKQAWNEKFAELSNNQ